MKLRTTCKCGAEFEVRGNTARSVQSWNLWLALHQRCLGIRKFDFDPEDGSTVTYLGPSPVTQQEGSS